MQVAIYSRFSSQLQREASIEDQERLCRERAAREGWTVAEAFADRLLRIRGTVALVAAAADGAYQVGDADDVSQTMRDARELLADALADLRDIESGLTPIIAARNARGGKR